ncbi:N-acetylmuramic acid 6-phosphate etherase [Bombilactobacillus folatiphilus]|uniref:N-acetylmuramic acid 6-phosphate etherase n=1 Tax=Bombilactobacillus folatiphilus TaxID=2923362 RepID=A0ABY4P8P0_9LACO|nr:N-acetylmuramic acid 6-phosphate etherase [Bombilactobacillus folatiphilus]UQS82084.1 N-acetylmuramic acid 6-phosphate etherase [Bombilactobacillus folatiphilus]
MQSTEQQNPHSTHIDELSTQEILTLINQEDQTVPQIIGQKAVLMQITNVVTAIRASLRQGGHIFYGGAGTSGRLAVLDAAETVPTYGVAPTMFQALIAGGEQAMLQAVEGAEDSVELGKQDLVARNFGSHDFYLGIAASGRTPYVIGGLDYARSVGAQTGSLACNPEAELSQHADFPIEVVTGPEVVTGSTRMKAGTAQKLVLNMISTTALIEAGKVYGNLMVDVQPTNAKLIDRAKRIIQRATDCDAATAQTTFDAAHQRPKTAIVMILTQTNERQADQLLQQSDDRIAQAVQLAWQKASTK